MDISPQGRIIAQRQFVVRTSQEKVWDLLATVTYQQLPLERVNLVSLDTFRAVLRWGVGFMRIPFYVEGRIVDTFRPNSYGCVIFVKRGPVQFGLKVAMILRGVDESKTEVFCIAMEEGKRTVLGWALRGPQRKFTLKIFDSIGARLQRLCS